LECKKKLKSPELDRSFAEFRLKEDQTKTMKIGADLSEKVKKNLTKCLQVNAYLFVWAANEMPRIDLEVAWHIDGFVL